MESNGRKVRGRCVVLTGPTLFCRPHGAPTVHTTTHHPQPMTRGPERRRDGLGEALPGGARGGGVDRVTAGRDGTPRNDRVLRDAVRCGRVSI